MRNLMTPDMVVLGRGIEDGVARFLRAATGVWPAGTR
jgi:hypothetical protein